MKPNTLSMRIEKAWPTVLQPLLLLLAVLVGVGSFVLVASGKQKSAKAPGGPPPSILMVGDSLSVGKFGEVVQGHLAQKYPVAAYASCGSSPEHWLSGEPEFITKCGYRQHTADTDVFRDFANGRRPRPTAPFSRTASSAASSGHGTRGSSAGSEEKRSKNTGSSSIGASGRRPSGLR
jgi:hypothetical protein